MFRRILMTILLVALFSNASWAGPNNYIIMRSWGKATYVESGLFSKEKYELAYSGGKWNYWNGSKRGQLKTPYECDYSELRNLRLEGNGRVYLVRKNDPSDRVAVQVIADEWQYNADGDWNLLIDLSSD